MSALKRMVSGKELYRLMDNSVFVNRANELAESPFLLFPAGERKYGPYWRIEWMGTDRKHWKGGENEAIISIHPADSYLRGEGAPWVNTPFSEMADQIQSMLDTPLKNANVNANYRLPVTSDDFPLEAGYYILTFNNDSMGDMRVLVAINPPLQETGSGEPLNYHPHLALMADKTAMAWDGDTWANSSGVNNLPAMLMKSRSNIGWGKIPHEDLVNHPDSINYTSLNY